MKKITLTLMLATVIAFGLAACGWKPTVTAGSDYRAVEFDEFAG